MEFLLYEDIYDSEGNPNLSEEVIKQIKQLTEIVVNNHFSYVGYYDREDLLLEGMAKALELIQEGKFDPSFYSSDNPSMKNYLYTGIRNEMSNYLYRNKKELPVGEFFGDQAQSFPILEEEYNIEFSVIKECVEKYNKRYGSYLGLVINKLESMGFVVNYKPKIIETINNYDESLLEKLVVFVLWKLRESYL